MAVVSARTLEEITSAQDDKSANRSLAPTATSIRILGNKEWTKGLTAPNRK